MNNPQTNSDSARISNVLTSIVTRDGELLEIYYHRHTGKIIKRELTYSHNGLSHAGIILGTDKYGNFWVAHNHTANKKPAIDSLLRFSSGKTVEFNKRKIAFTSIKVALRAIDEVLKANPFNERLYNAEIFITNCIQEVNKSITKQPVSDTAIVFGLLSAFLRVIE